MKRDLLLVGGGGHCRSCIDVIESAGEFRICGIVDNKESVGQSVLGYKIIGTDADLPRLLNTIKHCMVTVGQIKTAKTRKALFATLAGLNVTMPVIIASTAYVSRHAEIGAGTIIMHYAFVNAGAAIGTNGIINTGAHIEHDVRIGNNVHISTGAAINGGVYVGNDSFIGSNAVITETRKIAGGSIIGANTVVHRDIDQAGVFVGIPARRIGPK